MLEIAVFNLSSALTAAHSGADRIELCANYAVGGVTPSLSTLHAIRQQTAIPINVMIRPRAGNFYYSATEFEQMRQDVVRFRTLASGFVFGILDANRRVDVARNCELTDLAAPLPCTFHRAVDEVRGGNLEAAVDKVLVCGFKSVLMSGGGKTALEGVEKVASLQRKFGNRISLILGGGVRSTNVEELKRKTGVKWLHAAAITEEGEEVNGEEIRKMKGIVEGMGM